METLVAQTAAQFSSATALALGHPIGALRIAPRQCVVRAQHMTRTHAVGERTDRQLQSFAIELLHAHLRVQGFVEADIDQMDRRALAPDIFPRLGSGDLIVVGLHFGDADVAVEAVEIEGKKIFIAGQAKAGSTIRLYANGDILGETKATGNNRFLLEIERELAVGDYAISAEMLDANGQKVLAKAVVPFKREAGEAVVAVAPEAPKTGDVAAAPATTTEPASTEVAAAPAEPAAQDTATAPALKKVDTSVIIRRGDSLWRISRRIYGRGVRYSTIYLANKDAVKNPNRIWPGQVMMIPDKTAEGEAADMAEIERRKADSANQ